MNKNLTRKEKILYTALKIFAKQGYENSTIEEIAKEVGITKPAIYYYFRDKYAIYEEIFCQNFQNLYSLVKDISKDKDPKSALKSSIYIMGEYFFENSYFALLFLRELSLLLDSFPKKCSSLLKDLLNEIDNIIQEGVKEGYFKNQDRFTVELLIFSSILNYTSIKSLYQKLEIDINLATQDKILDLIYKTILEGIAI
ncbi:MAG: TetR/AcrR family transcriptional regulator [Epsilonproteobacteria bacterium]|nr:TetR/AcrR family transcriptional regulator [Campylobacterota bacterium]